MRSKFDNTAQVGVNKMADVEGLPTALASTLQSNNNQLIMKNALLGAAALLLTLGLSAQGSLNTSKGDIGILGGVGFGSSDNSGISNSNFDICLGGLYSVSDAWAAGLMVEYGTSKTKDDGLPGLGIPASEDVSTDVLVGPYARRYIGCGAGFNTFVGAEVGFGTSKSEYTSDGNTSDSQLNRLQAGLSFGLQYNLSNEVALELGFGGLRYQSLSDPDFDADPVTSLDFTAFSKDLSVGFQWYPFRGGDAR